MQVPKIVATGVVAAFLAPVRGGMVGVPSTDAGIQRVADAYQSAMLAGDAAAAAALYREDAIEMPPNHAPVQGRAAIEKYYRDMFGTCRFTVFALNHTELRAAGDFGYAVGTSRQTVAPAGRAPVDDAGKYLVVLQRMGGDWKVAYAMYNSDLQPPR